MRRSRLRGRLSLGAGQASGALLEASAAVRAFEITGQFGLDHLALAERPVPQPGRGQVRVRVRAATLNYRDLLVVQGLYNPKLRLPLIPVSDGAGVVDAVGEGVRRFRPGDRAVGVFFQGWLVRADRARESSLPGSGQTWMACCASTASLTRPVCCPCRSI